MVGRRGARRADVRTLPDPAGALSSVGAAPYADAMSAPLQDLLTRHVDAGTMPGVIASLGRDLDPIVLGTTGPGGAPLDADAIVRIQSMTKVITAVVALHLVEDGALGLDDPVERWMPELADRRVLRTPDAELTDTVPAPRPITLRHLLTNTSGYGMATSDSPVARAMQENRTAAGAEPPVLGAQDWLDALAALPLIVPPGEGWRYHHSFGLLGILLARVAGRPTGELLHERLFAPLGMPDTGFRVREGQEHRLPPALRHGEDGLEVTEAAGSGFHVGSAPFDESHGELVSTLADLHRFFRALHDGELLSPEHLEALRTDQVPAAAKAEDSFFPGFWDGTGWGYGVSVLTAGPHAGRYGWSGGQGTDVFVDPDGTICLVLTQVEMGERIMGLLGELQEVR